MVGEDHPVLDRLVAALAEAGRHGVGGVPEEGDPAAVVGGERLPHVADVVAQDAVRCGRREQGGHGVVPVAEAAQQFGAFVLGVAALGDGGGRVGVDGAVVERLAAPEGAAPPGLVGCEGLGGGGDHDAPGGEPGVLGARVAGEEPAAGGGADAVGGDHEVGGQLAGGGTHPGRAAGVVGGPGVDHLGGGVDTYRVLGEPGPEQVDQGGPVEQDEVVAVPLAGLLAAGAGQPASVGGTQAARALPGGQVPDGVAHADPVEGALAVGGQGDGRADRFEGGRPLQDGDVPAPVGQARRRGEAADPGADDEGAAAGLASGGALVAGGCGSGAVLHGARLSRGMASLRL